MFEKREMAREAGKKGAGAGASDMNSCNLCIHAKQVFKIVHQMDWKKRMDLMQIYYVV